jgi:hypothetical protein
MKLKIDWTGPLDSAYDALRRNLLRLQLAQGTAKYEDVYPFGYYPSPYGAVDRDDH